MRNRSIVFMATALLLGVVSSATPLAAQVTDPAAMTSNARRAMVTRAELTATLEEIDKQLASSAYSAALRDSKRVQANVIRGRLTEGDLRVGDVIQVELIGDAAGLSGMYAITQRRTLKLPGGAEIPMKGILRSEVQNYLTEELKKYVRDPIVRTTTSIRISVFGAVGKPGLYPAPADLLLGDVLMQVAGGPANNAIFPKSEIKRGDTVVVAGPEFQTAIRDGWTLDQLNIQAGDEIIVYGKTASSFWKIVGVIGSLAGLALTFIYIFNGNNN